MMVIFDGKEGDLRYSEFDFKPLFRRFSKDNHKKFNCTYQVLEGNIQKFVQENSECIKSYKVDFSTMDWIWIVLGSLI